MIFLCCCIFWTYKLIRKLRKVNKNKQKDIDKEDNKILKDSLLFEKEEIKDDDFFTLLFEKEEIKNDDF